MMDGAIDRAMARRDLEAIQRANAVCAAIIDGAGTLGLHDLGAGAVAQAVWNRAHGRSPGADIADYDLAYIEPDDLSDEAEKAAEHAAQSAYGQFGARIDVTNEDRVHLWYQDKSGARRGLTRHWSQGRYTRLEQPGDQAFGRGA